MALKLCIPNPAHVCDLICHTDKWTFYETIFQVASFSGTGQPKRSGSSRQAWFLCVTWTGLDNRLRPTRSTRTALSGQWRACARRMGATWLSCPTPNGPFCAGSGPTSPTRKGANKVSTAVSPFSLLSISPFQTANTTTVPGCGSSRTPTNGARRTLRN